MYKDILNQCREVRDRSKECGNHAHFWKYFNGGAVIYYVHLLFASDPDMLPQDVFAERQSALQQKKEEPQKQ